MTKVDWKKMGKGGSRSGRQKTPVRSGWSGGRAAMGEIYRIQSSMVRTGA